MKFDDAPRYVIPQQSLTKRELHPLVHAAIRLALLYVAVYSVCFLCEGVIRLDYGIGSVTAIEKRFSDRGHRAKALVERQKRLDAMLDDWRYGTYMVLIFVGTPIAMFWLIRHDIRLINQLLAKAPKPVRWWIIGMVVMLFNGLTVLIGPFVQAGYFYDRVSPAEILKMLR